MMTVLIVLSALFTYLVIGWALAARRLPSVWADARRVWSGRYYKTDQRNRVKIRTINMTLFWPFYGSGLLTARAFRALNRRLDSVLDAGDPEQAPKLSDPSGRMES